MQLIKPCGKATLNVAASGNAAQNLTLVAGMFASNMAIEKTQETLRQVLHDLRFKRVNYNWIPGADEYQYFTLQTPADSEIVRR